MKNLSELIGVDVNQTLNHTMTQLSGAKNPEKRIISTDPPTKDQLLNSIRLELKALAFNPT